MNTFPIDWSELIEAINQLKVDWTNSLNSSELIEAINQLKTDWVAGSEKVDYNCTYANFPLTIESETPTQIIDLPDGNDYEIILQNNSDNFIYLYLGKDGLERLTVNNSALTIKPRHGKITETSGCTLWGIAKEPSDIIVTVHSTKPNPILNEMVIALNVKLKVGTGDLLGKDIPLSKFAKISHSWEQILIDTIDSDQGITGNKLAYFKSFQPGETYEFNVNVDSNFTDFDTSKSKPLMVNLVDFNIAQAAMNVAVTAMGNVNHTTLTKIVKETIGCAKEDSWITNLPPTGGTFQVTPGNHQSILMFNAYTIGSTDACVITDFDKATNTFTLGGF